MSTKDLVEKTHQLPISIMIKERRLRWIGHAARHSDNNIAQQLLFATRVSGHVQPVGQPCGTWMHYAMRSTLSYFIGVTHLWLYKFILGVQVCVCCVCRVAGLGTTAGQWGGEGRAQAAAPGTCRVRCRYCSVEYKDELRPRSFSAACCRLCRTSLQGNARA